MVLISSVQNRRKKIILNQIHSCFQPFQICLLAVPWLCWCKGSISSCYEKFRGSGISDHSPKVCLLQGNAVGFVKPASHSEHRPGHSGDESPDGHQGLGVLLGQISCHHPDCCPQIPHQNCSSEAALSCWEMFQELATHEGAAGATRMGGAAAGRSSTQDSLCSGLFWGFTGIYWNLHPFWELCDRPLSGSLLMGHSEPQRLLRL